MDRPLPADAMLQITGALRRFSDEFALGPLDPAIAPGTGIPEFGGLSSRDVLTLIQSLHGLPLAGLDVVEVAPPIDPSEATVFAALKIIMEFIAVVARNKS